jgi:predicted nuclease of predicted toxin-antitoxin system
MKILLDECVTKRLKHHITDFEVFTIRELGLSGWKNGRLMQYCVDNNFDVLLTIDKNLVYQQNLDNYPISIVVLNSFTSKLEELITFIPKLNKQLMFLEKHKAYLIQKD